MVKTKDTMCNQCLGTGSVWDGEEYVECLHCDGQNHTEDFDSIIDLDDDEDYLDPPFDEYNLDD